MAENNTLEEFFSPINHGKEFTAHETRSSKWFVLNEWSDAVCDCGVCKDNAIVIAECLNRAASNALNEGSDE